MTQNKTILFVSAYDLTRDSGSGIATREIVAAFACRPDIDLTLICPVPDGGLPDKISRHVDDVISMPLRQKGSIRRHIKLAVDSFFGVRRAFRRREYDLIVSRSYPTLFSPAVYARLTGTRYALLSRGTSHKRLKFSSILTQVYKLNVKAADDVYAASEKIKTDANKIRTSQQSPAKVLSNAVNPDDLKPISKTDARNEVEGLDHSDFVVGFVGTMRNIHGVTELVSSLPKIRDAKNVKLLMVGDGKERETCEELVAELGIEDNVVFTGFVPHSKVPLYISACDVGYGAVKKSATPIKCYEYLSCEKPILVNAIKELAFVSDEKIGETIPDVSPESIAEGIDQLYTTGEEMRKQMGVRGRRYVAENHSWNSFAETVISDAFPANNITS